MPSARLQSGCWAQGWRAAWACSCCFGVSFFLLGFLFRLPVTSGPPRLAPCCQTRPLSRPHLLQPTFRPARAEPSARLPALPHTCSHRRRPVQPALPGGWIPRDPGQVDRPCLGYYWLPAGSQPPALLAAPRILGHRALHPAPRHAASNTVRFNARVCYQCMGAERSGSTSMQSRMSATAPMPCLACCGLCMPSSKSLRMPCALQERA